MMLRKKYNLKAEHIWYSPQTHTTSSKRVDKAQIKFDSRAEFELYRQILPLANGFGFEIYKDCKLDFEGTNWLVDFKLVFKPEQLPLVELILSHLNGYSTRVSLPIIHLEYKGVLTSQSCLKLDLLARSHYNHSLVMVGSEAITYTKENLTSLTTTIKRIHSARYFLAVLTHYIINHHKG